MRIDAIDTGQACKDDEESMGVVIASASVPLKHLQGCHDYNVALQCPRRARHSGMEDPNIPGGGKVAPGQEGLGESMNVEGGDGGPEKYSTMYLTLTMRDSVQRELAFFEKSGPELGKRVEVYVEAMANALNVSPQPFDLVVVTHLVAASHVKGYEASLKAATGDSMPPLPLTRFTTDLSGNTASTLKPADTFPSNRENHSVMQSLLKITPAAVWNKHRRPRWEYNVNFRVGDGHPGFAHYPNGDDDLGMVFMMFAKKDAAYGTKHELMAFGVVNVPPEAPCDGRSITFAGIPITMVGKTFKQAAMPADQVDEALPGSTPGDDSLLLRVRLRVWKGKNYARYILDGENGAPPDLSAGAINWISAASKLATGGTSDADLGAAVLSAQTAEASVGDTDAVRDEAKRRYEKRRRQDEDRRKALEDEAAATAEQWKKKRAQDDASTKQKEEAVRKKKAADEAAEKKRAADAKAKEETERKAAEAAEAKMAAAEREKKRKADAEAKRKREEAAAKKKAAEEAARKKREEEARLKKEKEDGAATLIQSQQRKKVAKAELARRKALLEAQKAKYAARYRKKLDALQNALDEYRAICSTNLKDAELREKEQGKFVCGSLGV